MLGMLFSAIFDGLNNLFLMLGYVSNVNSFPQPLNTEEEQHYVEAYRNGNEEARNVLIERNLRLVAHIVKKYSSCGSDSDDLISIGTIGLIKAISTFNMDKGTRLATYAARCIENAILFCVTHISPFSCNFTKKSLPLVPFRKIWKTSSLYSNFMLSAS